MTIKLNLRQTKFKRGRCLLLFYLYLDSHTEYFGYSCREMRYPYRYSYRCGYSYRMYTVYGDTHTEFIRYTVILIPSVKWILILELYGILILELYGIPIPILIPGMDTHTAYSYQAMDTHTELLT